MNEELNAVAALLSGKALPLPKGLEEYLYKKFG
jgi:hypothetical protein